MNSIDRANWVKYPDLEPIRRLKAEGRELLGRDIYITEKRDGSNIGLWINKDEIVISSHNLMMADNNLVSMMESVPEYTKIVGFLREEKQNYNHNYIAYGELISGRGATRIERTKKKPHWILFDLRDCENNRFLGYNNIHQHAYHWKIPIVRALTLINLNTMEELQNEIHKWLTWCRKHFREGIVGKNYGDQIFFKEKIDLPKLEKIKSESGKIQYPVMDEYTILRALKHAFDVIGEENWKDVKIAMPEVAKQMEVEAGEHFFSVPRNMYKIYLETSVDKIR